MSENAQNFTTLIQGIVLHSIELPALPQIILSSSRSLKLLHVYNELYLTKLCPRTLSHDVQKLSISCYLYPAENPNTTPFKPTKTQFLARLDLPDRG